MNTSKQLLILASFSLLVVGCVVGPQGWTERERDWFYNTSQGSRLIRYSWMIALERPDTTELFLSDKHIDGLRFLPRGFDPDDRDRPKHLPVGFVKGGKKDWLGFTCAACHTTDLVYRGDRIRIDGAGTLGDLQTFMASLTESVKNTYDGDDKFKRFAIRVLGADHPTEAGVKLHERLEKYKKVREDYEERNSPATADGFARLDAVGLIYNKVLHVVEEEERNANPAMEPNANPLDAPVSYPFLWGTDQSDYVQWAGFLSNANVGKLGRNVGELLGVFGEVDLEKRKHGYRSSVRAGNQRRLEKLVRKLYAPPWPEELPRIDQAKARRGDLLFQQHCVQCHNQVERKNVNREVVAWMQNLDAIGTDPKAAENVVNLRGRTGILKDRRSGFVGGVKFRDEAPVLNMVTHVVVGMLTADVGDALLDEFISIREGRGGKAPPKKGDYLRDDPLNCKPTQSFLAYKGRPLTGAWATAPYLHNGSVPSLYQLLTPPDERVKKFYVGTREFDPVEVGFEYKTETPGSFMFDTTIPGNLNSGHSGLNYGTDLTEDEKWALIEYMKTNMNPN